VRARITDQMAEFEKPYTRFFTLRHAALCQLAFAIPRADYGVSSPLPFIRLDPTDWHGCTKDWPCKAGFPIGLR
jgi:hypothetical protein